MVEEWARLLRVEWSDRSGSDIDTVGGVTDEGRLEVKAASWYFQDDDGDELPALTGGWSDTMLCEMRPVFDPFLFRRGC